MLSCEKGIQSHTGDTWRQILRSNEDQKKKKKKDLSTLKVGRRLTNEINSMQEGILGMTCRDCFTRGGHNSKTIVC